MLPQLLPEQAAAILLTSLQDDDLAVTAAVKTTAWLMGKQQDSILEVRALVCFQSALRLEDWQITRQILCVLCSERSIQALAQITGVQPSIEGNRQAKKLQCQQFAQAINSLNLIGGSMSVGLAVARSQLSLRAVHDDHSNSASMFEYQRSSPHKVPSTIPEFAGVSLFDAISSALNNLMTQEEHTTQTLNPYITKSFSLYTIPRISDQGSLAPALDIPHYPSPGVIFKAQDSSAEAEAEFCFLATNEPVRLGEEHILGELLEETFRAKRLFLVKATVPRYDQRDRRLICNWIQTLKG